MEYGGLLAFGLALLVVVQLAIAGGVTPVSTSGAVDERPVVDRGLRSVAMDGSAPGAANNSTVMDLDESQLSGVSTGQRDLSVSDEPTEVVVEATAASAVNRSRLERLGSEVGSRHGRYVEVTASPSATHAIRNLTWVADLRPTASSKRATISEGVESMDADDLHALNVTGDGTKVGIITGGVKGDFSDYSGQVAATKSFHTSGLQGGDATHGTAVTELVADTAPNASLYLTAFDSQVDFANAASWLVEKDVDIIITSVGYVALPDDGSSLISQTATEATEQDIFWANAAGNAAKTHWQGSFASPDGDSWLNFGPEDEVNALNGGNAMPAGTPVGLYLNWDDFPTTTEDYTVYLLDGDGSPLAKSHRLSSTPDRPVEVLQYTIPYDGYYSFAVAGASSSHTIEVIGSDSTRRFEHRVANGSIMAPAVARGVTGVGAYHVDTGDLAPYSSLGTTTDGRRGIDILGPSKVSTQSYSTFAGTSAAAPHVAGAAALLHSLNGSVSGAQLEAALMAGATEAGPSGYDTETGAGIANVTAAAEYVDPSVNLTVVANQSRISTGEWVRYTVTRADTGEPVNATLWTSDTAVSTGADGTGSIQYTESGTKTVVVNPNHDPAIVDYRRTSTNVTIASEPARNLSLRLSPTNVTVNESTTVTATVTTANRSEPVPDATVSFVGAGSTKSNTTGQDGRTAVRINASTSGLITVTANATDYNETTETLPAVSPTASNASHVTVTLQPRTATVQRGTNATYEILVGNASDDVGSANVAIRTGNASVAAIQTIDPADGIPETVVTTAVSSSVAELRFAASNLTGTGPTTIGSVTVEGVNDGSTEATLSVESVGTPQGTSYEIGGTLNASLVVSNETGVAVVGSTASTDGDGQFAGDGVHQDVNGDGSVTLADVTALFSNYNSDAVQTNPGLFDFNGDSKISLADVTTLFNAAV